MPFKFQSRYVLLTYSQCGELDPFDVVNHLSSLGAECIVGREPHADGGTHLHAFVDFGRRYSTRRSDAFDVGGYHPNIAPSRGRAEGGWDYATKEGDIVAGGLERPSRSRVSRNDHIWDEVINQPDESAFWECVQRLDPKAAATQFTQLRAYASWAYAVQPEQYEPNPEHAFDTGMVPELDRWRRESLGDDRQGTFAFSRSGRKRPALYRNR
ncbi:Rep1 [Miniopterus associated gemycircularvirus 1]|uniref:Rep1 n=1 Tax=Miniopterus associated gemycircularvirus 1 TaxID=1985387 RepID=A0A0D3MCJ4_9VIRU|nr:Rep1 [Miniopterus associated gemycircularvirus 1]AIF76256.1 Rep1 [Miniopterus associated gemycircularvirus 1]